MNSYKNRTVLVTGGSGFIGANLVRSLINQSAKVHLFLRPKAKIWRLTEIIKKPKFIMSILRISNRLKKQL